MKHHFIERQVRHQPLQLRVFLLQLLQLAYLVDVQTDVLLLPVIEGLLRGGSVLLPTPPLEHRHNLLYRESLPLHGKTSSSTRRFLTQNLPWNSHYDWYRKRRQVKVAAVTMVALAQN